MRILIVTIPFTPQVGGVEMVSSLLARQFCEFGFDVCVVTSTANRQPDEDLPYRVVRRPSAFQLVSLSLWADLSISMGISLRLLWPRLLLRPRFLVSHHIHDRSAHKRLSLRRLLERFLCRNAVHVAPSAYLAGGLPFECAIVGNPYVSLNRVAGDVNERPHEVVFVGRLIPEKGPLILLDAIEILAKRGREVRLTIIGDGPLRSDLEGFAADREISTLVTFTGSIAHEAVCSILTRHRIVVIPSVWEEPFGLVALEAISCGCGIISSGRGGLPEAVGPCGHILSDLTPQSLADSIVHLLDNLEQIRVWQSAAVGHLSQFQPDIVANRYLTAMVPSN